MYKKLTLSLLFVGVLFGHYPNIIIYSVFGFKLPLYLVDLAIFNFLVFSLVSKLPRNRYVDFVLLSFFLINGFLLLINIKLLFSFSSFLYLSRFLVYLFSYPVYFLLINKIYLKPILIMLLVNFLVFLRFPVVSILEYDPHIYRLYGQFIDPNLYSVILVILLIYLFSLHNSLLKILTIFLTFVSIFLTFSRIGIILAVFFLIFYAIKNKSLTVFNLLVAFILLVFTSTRFASRLLFQEGNFDSFFYRVLSYIEGIMLYSRSTIAYGFNNIGIYKEYLTSSVNNSSTYTDSVVLNLLLSGGIFSVLLVFTLLISISKKKKGSLWSLLLFIVVLSSFVMNTFFQPVFMLIISMSLGYLVFTKDQSIFSK